MILKIYVFIITLFIFGNCMRSQNKIAGKWLPADKLGHIEIFREDSNYYGRIVCVNEPINPKTGNYWQDSNNPDSSKRKRTIVGIRMMFNFEYDKKTKEFIKGKLYDVRTGKTYKGKMWLENGKLVLRGYWFLFYKTEKWERVKDTCG